VDTVDANPMDATLTYVDAVGGTGTRKLSRFSSVEASTGEAAVTDSKDAEVASAAVRVRVAELIVRAVASARSGRLPQALSLVDQAEKLAREGAERYDDEEL